MDKRTIFGTGQGYPEYIPKNKKKKKVHIIDNFGLLMLCGADISLPSTNSQEEASCKMCINKFERNRLIDKKMRRLKI